MFDDQFVFLQCVIDCLYEALTLSVFHRENTHTHTAALGPPRPPHPPPAFPGIWSEWDHYGGHRQPFCFWTYMKPSVSGCLMSWRRMKGQYRKSRVGGVVGPVLHLHLHLPPPPPLLLVVRGDGGGGLKVQIQTVSLTNFNINNRCLF